MYWDFICRLRYTKLDHKLEEGNEMKNTAIRFVVLWLFYTTTSLGTALADDNVVNIRKIKAKIDGFMTTMVEKRFSGAVMVDYKGKKLLSKGYGKSDRENGFDYTPNTISDMGSITKQFTAAAILKLEMQGKLSVHDKISKYLDNIPQDKATITLHHLLTHSSGIHRYSGEDFDPDSEKRFLEIVMSQKLLFQPGEKYHYSNPAYSLLAIIVERVSGSPYEDYLYQNILKPANMNHTGYARLNFDSKNVAVGYRNIETWGKPTEKPWDKYGPYWHLKGNGGLLSTAEDFYNWHIALLGEKVLSKKAKQKYFYPHILSKASNQTFSGYGWFIEPTNRKTRLTRHNGANGFIFADIYRYIDEQVTIILFTNAYDTYSIKIARQIAGIIFEPDYEPEKKDGYKSLSELIAQGKTGAELVTFIKQQVQQKTPSDYAIEQHNLNRFGYVLLERKKHNDALAVFKLNTEMSPNSPNAYDSYGETLILMRQIKNGVKAYQQALAIEPDYENAEYAKKVIEQYADDEGQNSQ